MMNSKKSSRYQLVRYVILGVLVGGLVLSLNYTRASAALNFIRITTDTTVPVKKFTVTPRVVQPDAKTIKGTPVKKGSPAVNTITVRGNGDPVYVVDGVAVTKAVSDALNPNSIAQVDVLKNVSGLEKESLISLYGEGVNNGIVFIELKNPTPAAARKKLAIRTRDETLMEPLILVDGKELPDGQSVNDISPDKISSMEVLKDNAAKARYGSAGNNGVILIKTKPEGRVTLQEIKMEVRKEDSTTVK